MKAATVAWWHVLIICVPGLTYFVNPGTTFLSDNVILSISYPYSPCTVNKQPNLACKPKLAPQIVLVDWNVVPGTSYTW